ncbi:hypothetical protein Bca4012_056137 [Brassica carinata]|uniref:Uncharacterized protein n=1 Tax=Brassica carinata TaxID=52824 RepID=A0A8X7W0A7_BRACI|nr:hypothetical protein Bca52824_014037 [Brassica carinata]
MVLRGEMTTPTTRTRAERPKSLHNFTLPSLKWGSQRHLKCSRIESLSSGSGDHRLRRRSPPFKLSVSIPPEHRRRSDNRKHRRAPFESAENGGEEEEEEEEGIEEFRVKIMSDLKTVRDKITQSMFREKALEGEEEEEEGKTADESSGREKVSPVKPWNLRKRRAACKEPVETEERIVNPSPPSRVKERGGVVEAETTREEMMRRPKFSVKLSKKEIEEDFMAALGHRPPRRPKKRPRTVQKKLDSLHPGFYLSEATLDAYKVPEETKNMQR